MARTVLRILALSALAAAAGPDRAGADALSFLGTPGLLEMPGAGTLADGALSATLSGASRTTRATLTFQATPRLTAAFRYAALEGFNPPTALTSTRYDRSFDLSYRLAGPEDGTAVAIGLQDVGGSGLFSGEYVVAQAPLSPEIAVTAGLGWGRLAGGRPLFEPFGPRPDATAGTLAQTGRLDVASWFRGPVAAFGGLRWERDGTAAVLEWSSDDTRVEEARGFPAPRSRWNFGVTRDFGNGLSGSLAVLRGRSLGARLSYTLDPAQPPVRNAGLPAPMPFGTASASRGGGDGVRIEGVRRSGNVVSATVTPRAQIPAAQALGRAARTLTSAEPVAERFLLTLTAGGLPVTTAHMSRRALQALEFADGAGRDVGSRVHLSDAAREPLSPPVAPAVWAGGYVAPLLFDPARPVRLDYGLRGGVVAELGDGWSLSGEARLPLGGSAGRSERRAVSPLPVVRSDAGAYAGRAGITRLTAARHWRPGPDLYGRVTAGLLEPMYAGASAELLWAPQRQRFAFGIEANAVRKRAPGLPPAMGDYGTVTGHVSAYGDLGGGYRVQVDAGRYLAGDWGGTLTLSRDFANGMRVAGFATLTDAGFDRFGEGSFDKGIVVELPLTWLTGRPDPRRLGQTIRPVQRDGGARLDVAGRLEPMTRPLRQRTVAQGWEAFWR